MSAILSNEPVPLSAISSSIQVAEYVISSNSWLGQGPAVEVAVLVLNCIEDAEFQRPELLALVASTVARLDRRLSRPMEDAEAAVMRIFAREAGVEAGRVASAVSSASGLGGRVIGEGGLAALARSARLVRAFVALAAYRTDSVPVAVHTASFMYPKVSIYLR